MKIAIIIVAAGNGKRLGIDKAVMPINGKPLFYYSCAMTLTLNNIFQVILVIKPKHFMLVRSLFGKKIDLTAGGKERNNSVVNGLNSLKPQVTHVLVHDAARPFTSQETFNKVLTGLKTNPAVICGIFAQDTVKLVKNDTILKTLPRNEIFLAQTPQGFDRKLLVAAYRKLKKTGVTDDAQVVQMFGEKIKVVEGSRNNIKITYKEDLNIVKKLMTSFK
jgi:2-C-methyl-D-erythritol 4-phosphate cytidylyltransferase